MQIKSLKNFESESMSGRRRPRRKRNPIEYDKENEPQPKRRRLSLMNTNNNQQHIIRHYGTEVIKRAREYELAERLNEALIVYQIAFDIFYPNARKLKDKIQNITDILNPKRMIFFIIFLANTRINFC